jgi:hypothetical protein
MPQCIPPSTIIKEKNEKKSNTLENIQNLTHNKIF